MPAIRMILAVLAKALGRVSPNVVATIAKKLGTAASPSAILTYIRQNPTAAILIAAELGPDVVREVGDLYHQMSGPGKEPMPRPTGLTIEGKVDAVPSELVSSIQAQQQEMRAIRTAAASLGGMSNLLALRTALSLSNAHYELFNTLNGSRI